MSQLTSGPIVSTAWVFPSIRESPKGISINSKFQPMGNEITRVSVIVFDRLGNFSRCLKDYLATQPLPPIELPPTGQHT
jgi:hypothetical protein